ncbi:MAG: lamin tail domain-containing protein [Chitinophagales bacterium]
MKQALTFLFLISLSCSTAFSQPCSDLFISEYVEGGSFNKAIEIYNPTTGTVQLDGYQLLLYSNGTTTASFKFKLHGPLASHDVFVIVHPQADATLLTLADTTNIVCNWNGNDAILLVNNNVGDTIDGIGVVGEDPGDEWPVSGGSTKDHSLVRTVETQEGTTDWAIGSQQWYAYAQNDFSQLGFHDVNICPVANPEIAISADSSSIPEGIGTFSIKINILNPNASATTAQVKVTGGTATQGTDYFFTDQTVTFPAGSGDPVILTLTVVNDVIAESDETIEISLQNATNNATIGASLVTLKIIDDEGLGIAVAKNIVLTTYPNPFDNLLHVESPFNIEEVSLHNVLGENMLQRFSPDSKQIDLELGQLPVGIYILKVISDHSMFLKRVVKN